MTERAACACWPKESVTATAIVFAPSASAMVWANWPPDRFTLSPLVVTVNGESVNLSGGQFAHTIALAEGANTIAVAVTDSLGQQAQAALSVIRDLTPPVVSRSEERRVGKMHQ